MDQATPLVVVDVQNGFVTSHSRHIVRVVNRVVECWLEASRPVFLTRFINTPNSSWQSLMGWQRLQSEPEIDLHPTLGRYLANPLVSVMDKTTYTSITGKVRDYIEASNASAVAVCGIATDGCVLKTALDVFDMGRRPLVIEDACASHAGAAVHEAAMMILSRQLGRDQIIRSSELRGRPAA
jgi:nicotinamidase-related amidase